MKQYEYDLKLIKLVKALRERNGFKHINLSEPLGISRTTYGRIENSELSFTPAQFKIMAHELNTNHIQLLSLADSDVSEYFHNTTLSTLLIKTLKMLEGKNDKIDFSEAELYFVIDLIKKKYEEMWLEKPSLRY
jgi:hypothetical protein